MLVLLAASVPFAHAYKELPTPQRPHEGGAAGAVAPAGYIAGQPSPHNVRWDARKQK